MKRTFFEYLGIADMEKIHSQTIQWILSKDNKSLSSKQKNDFLSDFLGIPNFSISEVITEYNKIDILIKSSETIICIENKLKSSQHSGQLGTYKNIIQKEYGKTNTCYFFFLTLIDEKPNDADWKNISYKNLLKSLQKLTLKNNTDSLILKEYIKTLENFSAIIDDFLKKPSHFINVFIDGYKTKHQKKKENKNEKHRFISDNQLETIFQKLYLKNVATILKLKDFYLIETHGNAILGVVIKSNFLINDKPFNFAFDYQNGTFKTNCTSSNYQTSKTSDIPEMIPILFEKIKEDGKYGYKRVNKPTAKAQYSMTKKDKSVIGLDIKEFAKKFKTEMEIAREIIEREILKTFTNK